MNFDKFTIKSQEVIRKAVELTSANGQQAVEPAHILSAMFSESEQVLSFLFGKLQADGNRIRLSAENEMRSFPRVSGGEPYLSRTANDVLLKAQELAKTDGDEYVSVEELLLALVCVKSTIQKLLNESGVSENGLRKAIVELRKGGKVTSADSEATYQALDKYAINLNERARNGKLDPVIGRDADSEPPY